MQNTQTQSYEKYSKLFKSSFYAIESQLVYDTMQNHIRTDTILCIYIWILHQTKTSKIIIVLQRAPVPTDEIRHALANSSSNKDARDLIIEITISMLILCALHSTHDVF